MIHAKPSVLAMALAAGLLHGSAHPAGRAAAAGGPLDPRIETLVASVSPEHLQQLLEKLAGFKTRNTLSDPKAPDGIGAARQWILDELTRSSPKLQVVPIQAVFNNDIVGNATGGNGIVDGASVRIYSEGPEDTPSSTMRRTRSTGCRSRISRRTRA